ncbi:MAG: IS66 family transposase zinc-finger binding domain-containing protein [Deltaproteobacteria bacterium]|nr:IS66 family transposase zinc-finger binding domain-containing protein [Deltaproteobacteria bacterium]
MDLDRVSDLELLRTVAKVQEAEIRRLSKQLLLVTKELAAAKKEDSAAIQERLSILAKELQEVQERAYGHQSERRPRSDKPTKEKKPQTGHGPTPQPDLPTVTELHVLDQPDRACPSCGGELKPWLDQFEDSEEVDLVDVKYVLKKHRRQKYRCGCGGRIETALGPTCRHRPAWVPLAPRSPVPGSGSILTRSTVVVGPDRGGGPGEETRRV